MKKHWRIKGDGIAAELVTPMLIVMQYMIEHCWHCCRLLASPSTHDPETAEKGPWVCCSMLHGPHRRLRHLDGPVSHATHSGLRLLRFMTSFDKSKCQIIFWYSLIYVFFLLRRQVGVQQDKPWEVTPALDRFSTRWGTEPTPRCRSSGTFQLNQLS